MADSKKDLEDIYLPALPVPSAQYDFAKTNQTTNILRLFFNKLVGTISGLLDQDDGGRFLYFPRGLFYSTQDQTAALANTGYALTYNNTYIGNGVSIVSNSRITVSHAGIYNFQVTMQVDHTNSSACTLWTWINKSGVDVDYGTQEHTVTGNSLQVVHWNFSIDLAADDYIEMYWATTDTALSMHTHVATAPHPGVPAAVVAVSYVSNIP